jgi:hypothetical protein
MFFLVVTFSLREKVVLIPLPRFRWLVGFMFGGRSPKITRDHQRSPEITRDHQRSPEITGCGKSLRET